MGPFQQGLSMLLAGTRVPVVPCRIDGAFAAWPARRRWPRPGAVRVRIGAPVREAATDPSGRAAGTQALRDAVVTLGRRERTGD
jgi:1-acyl-sn-glycerol-3-phosphate acyltransferase